MVPIRQQHLLTSSPACHYQDPTKTCSMTCRPRNTSSQRTPWKNDFGKGSDLGIGKASQAARGTIRSACFSLTASRTAAFLHGLSAFKSCCRSSSAEESYTAEQTAYERHFHSNIMALAEQMRREVSSSHLRPLNSRESTHYAAERD